MKYPTFGPRLPDYNKKANEILQKAASQKKPILTFDKILALVFSLLELMFT